MDQFYVLKSGERLHVNDYAYLSPPWHARDGTAYSIGRIMEFLPPKDTDHQKGKGKAKEKPARVRVAWCYRAGDLIERQVSDPRLLLVALFSEVLSVKQLRSKCFVRHKDKISDLVAWKKKPDRFYFHRLFDPYIKREFEVLLTSDVTNLPNDVKDVLCTRYEFIACEKEFVQELTDPIHLCGTCSNWCANVDSVRCDTCKNFYHMACVQPPLSAKPSRGYGWSCASCARPHDVDIEAQDIRHGTPPVRGKAVSRVQKLKKPTLNSLTDDRESDDKYFKMWPFRYFGQYTVAEDTLDPNDLIFPRTATRIGPRFQTAVPNVGEKPSTDEVPERGGDATIEIMSWVHHMPSSAATEVEQRKTALGRKDMLHNVDYLTEVIARLSQAYLAKQSMSSVSLKNPVSNRKWDKSPRRYIDREWNDEEARAFNAAAQDARGDLRSVREEIPSRAMAEIVRYFVRWKNAQLRLQHRQAQLLALSTSKQVASESDDEGSIVVFDQETPDAAPATIFCGSCRTRDSAVWWKAPKGTASSVLCDVCGLNWRKYDDHGYSRIAREDPAAVKRNAAVASGTGSGGHEKREGTPQTALTKRQKTGAVSGDSTPTPPPLGKQPLCQCCKKPNAHGRVLKCRDCTLTVHAATCGAIYDEELIADWLCDLCQNKTSLEASLSFECMLCPRMAQVDGLKLQWKRERDHGSGFLRSAKPTEGQGWVHTLCSLFHPDVQYADASVLRTVEGVSTVSISRWSQTCSICNLREGATIKCFECPVEVHVSCAWRSDFRFGFEMQAVKPSKRDVNTSIFRGISGVLVPYVACARHSPDTKRIFSLCDMNHTGETVLQMYTRTSKQIAAGHSYPLLRKARRLDQLIPFHGVPTASASAAERAAWEREQKATKTSSSLYAKGGFAEESQKCSHCETEYSPMFYPDGDLWTCHRCHWNAAHSDLPAQTSALVVNGTWGGS
ncbi:hypothetical protein BKA62DRAFT_713863 [Auriculariales sp. MPI-PUGE-AT-0066]|nr:hypothetical protein BKA62DRAFT_713863 [Auriculariales sp. MPI-PUGE-AT-0066]